MSAEVTKPPCYLIVDDSVLSLRWLSQILKGIGPCEIVEAEHGVEAIEKLASAGDRFEAIISDFRMPVMNGLELLKEVRLARTGAAQSVPFFIITGFAERPLAGLALGLDVDAFLARPVKKEALKRHLIRTCAERRRDKTLAEAEAAYGDVDLSLAMAPGAQPAELPKPQASPSDAAATVNGERLMALKNVPEGAHLARDAVNATGAVLLSAGEEITAGLKAVLMSYAEVDKSLAEVWVAHHN